MPANLDANAAMHERLSDLVNEARCAADQEPLTDPVPIDGALAAYVDSMALAALVMLVEQEWEIELDDDDISPEHFANLRSLAQLIELKLTDES